MAPPSCTQTGWTYIVSSAISFIVTRHIILPRLLSRTAHPPNQPALLANHIISYIHALCSTTLVLATFVGHPNLLTDMQGLRSGADAVELSRFALGLSTGYFIGDCLDMAWTGVYAKNMGIWGHHAAAIVCYVASLQTCLLHPYLVFTLLVEINSIFIHHRKVLLLHYKTILQIPSALRASYTVATRLLYLTFPPTRIIANLYLTYCVLADSATWAAPAWTWWLALGGMSGVDYYNFILWGQVKKSLAREQVSIDATEKEKKDGASRPAVPGKNGKNKHWAMQSGSEFID